MVNHVVERATSDMLNGPDWGMNIGVCDICNRDPGQVKDVVKGIKKRLGSKNVKVQLLALTLLETIMKNCGDFVHMNVAERDLLRDMVKMVKKKPDFHVKEKILILIDTWQEAFGGARARYPQYYAAYNELLHMGAIFPKRTERSPPVFTPLQTQPLKRNPQNGIDAVESSADAELPILSMKEIQNERHIIGVLAEMLTAIDPEKKEELRQEVVADMVTQCRTYKKRLVHLVNSTSDESLLCEGLDLNDSLQRVLDKYEALVSGVSFPLDKLNPITTRALVPIDAPLIGTRKKQNNGSTADAGAGAQLPAPITTNGTSATPGIVNPKFDLLSGDDFSTPTTQTSVSTPLVGAPLQNYSPRNLSAGQTDSSSPQFQNSGSYSSKRTSYDITGSLAEYEPPSRYAHGSIPAAQRTYSGSLEFEESRRFPSQETSFIPNGSRHTMVPPQYESMFAYAQRSSPTTEETYYSSPQFQHFRSFDPNGSFSNVVSLQCEPTFLYSQESNSPTWNGHFSRSSSPDYGTRIIHGGGGLPPPPWETSPVDTNQSGSTYYPPPQHQLQTPANHNNHMTITTTAPPPPIHGLPPHQIAPPYDYGGGYTYGYGYTQLQNSQFLDHRISRLSITDDGFLNSTVYADPSTSENLSKPEDMLFKDLVNFNIKPNKTTGEKK